MDSQLGGGYDVLWRPVHRSTIWYENLDSDSHRCESFLASNASRYLLTLILCRQLWTYLYFICGYLLPRLWPNDGINLHEILPIHPVPGRLLTNRHIHDLLSLHVCHNDLVPEASRPSSRRRRYRLVYRRRDLSNHGREIDTSDWLWMDHEDMRVLDSRSHDHHTPHREKSLSSDA